jgi:putative tributyrin esterase
MLGEDERKERFCMACCLLHYRNRVMGKTEPVSILLPEAGHQGPFPVLYLLHGIGDDHTDWIRRTRIEQYCAELPLMVVMPTTPWQSFYVDSPVTGLQAASAIAVDLVDYIDARFQTVAQASQRAVCGLSMGGYGALHLALRFPERFGTAISLSGALTCFHVESDRPAEPNSPEDRLRALARRIYGAELQSKAGDLFALAESLPAAKRPALRIDCGTDDFLLAANRQFHAHLERIGYEHEYAEYPGGHTWDYWDAHVVDALRFFARRLGLISPQ